ncbi:hypothetical protein B0H11DRAFT_2073687 [Mycena galericulata]|nr:hypothetical protein B0H11DRAFT_2073687 [Mycena galericulata]
MKNFFQRKQDTQPPRSTTPANAYKVWLPPAEASRAGPGPNSWIPSTQSGARRGGETYRGSSRPDVSSVPTSSAYKYATVPNNTNFYYPNNPAQAAPLQSFPPQYYPPSLPHPPDRPDSRLGYIPYPYPNPQYPQSFAAPATSKRREAPSRNALDARGATVPTPEPATRPSSSTKQSEKDDRPRVPRQSSSSSVREQRREDTEVKKPKHKTRESSETRKRKDSVVESYADKYRDKNSRKESRRNGSKSRPVEEVDSSDSSIQRPSSSTGHRHRRLEEGKMV